jgi:hypothetical protein
MMLNDLEKGYLRTFWENEGMKNVVFKFLNQNFEVRPIKGRDDEIGQEVRAMWRAREIVSEAFMEMGTFEVPKDKGRKENQAR